MKKRYRVPWLLAGAGAMFLMIQSPVSAADKVVVVPLNSTMKTANATTPCNASNAGLTRWSGSAFEGCDGTAWIFLSVPTVYSSGHEWMDRNLGASRVAESSNDEQAYGDLYQWGRFHDGHEKRNSITLQTQSSSDVPGHGNFILPPETENDWRNPSNDNLWQNTGVNNPCPPGFRLPTNIEWQNEMQSWVSQNATGAFASPLKLVLAGRREGVAGSIGDIGKGGNYWSSDGGTGLFFYNSNATMGGVDRKSGLSVRCVKD
ncbi:MAG TPA: hypothetical protein ENI88_03285 [Desulfobulbus sp.]|nr:hypothetical protein [Desulfobulbus sp.]